MGRLLFTIAVLAGSMLLAAPHNAEACSYAPAEWTIQQVGNTAITAPGLPIAFKVEGYDNPFEELPPLDDSQFSVVVLDVESIEVPGTVEFREGQLPGQGRVVFTPTEPWAIGGSYTATITAASEFGGEVTVALDVLSELGQPGGVVQIDRLFELEVPGESACCTAKEGDASCGMDDCGSYEFGEECELCWVTEWRYPVTGYISWQLGSDTPTSFLDVELVQVLPDGDVPVPSGSAVWEPDFDGDYCLRIDVHDVIRDIESSSAVVCAEGSPEVAERTELPEPQEDRCASPPSTTGGEEGEGGEPSGDKGEPGGCATAASGSSWLPAIAIALFAGLGRRRR